MQPLKVVLLLDGAPHAEYPIEYDEKGHLDAKIAFAELRRMCPTISFFDPRVSFRFEQIV